MFAAMSSPAFLGLYITLSALALGVAWYAKQRLDPTKRRAIDEEFSREATPVEVAYLVGGSEQVARHALMGLVGRGYLETQTYDAAFASQLIVSRAEGAPGEGLLTGDERGLLALVEEPRSVSSLLEDPRLHEVLAATCEHAHEAR